MDPAEPGMSMDAAHNDIERYIGCDQEREARHEYAEAVREEDPEEIHRGKILQRDDEIHSVIVGPCRSR